MTSRAQVQRLPVRRKRSTFLWLIPTQMMALAAAAGAAAGENLLRLALLGGMLSTMLIPLLASLEAGLFAIMIFEPFRGFLRRAQYILVPYSDTEPIHLLVPIATLCAFLMVLFRHKLETIRLTPLAGLTTALAALCFVQMFNPLQGSLFIGLTGGLFYLVPMAWFYFGQTVSEDFVPKLFRIIVFLGIVTSLYGVYQLVFGYPFYEKYWIDHTDQYNSIAVDNIQRALATFNNSEEWGRYIQIGCTIAIGLTMSRAEKNKRVIWFIAAVLLFIMIAFTGQRTSIFGVMLSGGILFLTGARNMGGIIARMMILIAPVVLIGALSSQMGDDSGANLDENNKVGTMLNHTTKGTVNPTGEGSLEARFDTWSQLITRDIPSKPMGVGLGATTLAGTRADAANSVPIDNHFFSLAISAGIPAMLLLLWILIRATVFCYRGWRRSEPGTKEETLWRIMLALVAAFILNNFFGTSFIIYSIAPIGWLVIGWTSAAYQKLENAEPIVEIVENDEWINAKRVSY